MSRANLPKYLDAKEISAGSELEIHTTGTIFLQIFDFHKNFNTISIFFLLI